MSVLFKKYLFLKNHFKKILFGLILLLVCIWQISLEPRLDKNWRPENEKLSTVLITDDSFEILNFRDFYFDSRLNFLQENWIDSQKFSFSDLESVFFGVSHFAAFEGAAHTFLNFRFKNGNNFSYSIEMRLEKEEKFSPWNGLLRQHEIYIAVGTDRDILGRRAGIKDEKLFVYELDISAEKQRAVLDVVLNNINNISVNPEFYNTLTDNCTTSLVGVAEEVKGQNILWTFSHLLPGYFDEKAFKRGLFKNPRNLKFNQLKQNSRVFEGDF